jgi:hypothetical protein
MEQEGQLNMKECTSQTQNVDRKPQECSMHFSRDIHILTSELRHQNADCILTFEITFLWENSILLVTFVVRNYQNVVSKLVILRREFVFQK